jgi:hypothetical protein
VEGQQMDVIIIVSKLCAIYNIYNTRSMIKKEKKNLIHYIMGVIFIHAFSWETIGDNAKEAMGI